MVIPSRPQLSQVCSALASYFSIATFSLQAISGSFGSVDNDSGQDEQLYATSDYLCAP